MKWFCYVYRMENTRIPNECLSGELSTGKRSQDRPKLRYKDVCKNTMKHLPIDPKSWKRIALDRAAWMTAVRTGAALQEEMLRAEWEEKRDKKKQKTKTTTKKKQSQILTPLRAVTAAGPAAQVLAGLATKGAEARETDI